MDEIVSILQNPDKMEVLISKLKTIGEDSPQFQTFKTSIDSFHLNKPHRGVHQTNILQNVFKYSDSRECFDSFRLVCKSWQNAVETIRLDTCPPLEIFQELCLHERNSHFPLFYSKYLKRFRKLILHLDRNFDMTRWNSLSNFLLQNMKNLSIIRIFMKISIPSKFHIYLFNLLANSQSTLTHLSVSCKVEMLTLPPICLPNLKQLVTFMHQNQNNDVDAFDYMMKTFVNVMCKDLKFFQIYHIHESPNILKYITKNYPSHFVCGPEISVLEHMPLKISHLNLENLAAYRYTSHIQYLILYVKNLHAPSEGGWDDYKEILSFFPNLKGIVFYYNNEYTNLGRIPSFFVCQTVWQERIDYLKSQNLKILNTHEFSEIVSELRQSLSPLWSFDFKGI